MAAAVALVASPASVGAAGADAGPTDTASRAVTAAARVERLTAEYRRHSAAAAAAALELTRAYAVLDAAERRSDAAGSAAAQARSRRASRTLALYAYGPAADSGLALLAADSPEEGLWRVTVGGPVAQQVLAGTLGAERDTARRAAHDDLAAVAARSTTDDLGVALGRLREEETAARQSLDAARAEYGRLDAQARSERAAREAAAALARAQADAAAGGLGSGGPMTALTIPADFERAYRGAATTCPGMDWQLLAAVGQVESGHGRNNGPSSAGAIGPMQFMPGTFSSYGVDGDGDGAKDAWDPEDAIFSAAHYLCTGGAGGGPDGVRRALFRYNHAQWYVDLVLSARAAVLAAHPS